MTHRHLSSEEILDSISAGEPLPDLSGCESCRAEASSLSSFLVEMRRADAEPSAESGWDDLLLRRRIREAIASEKPHGRSIFDRFSILRPAFISALAACVALVVWSPLARHSERGSQVASMSPAPHARIPAWVPLPEESEDEGLAVLAEWTPNADEVSIASCHFSCLSGLSEHEEENLLSAVATASARTPLTQASPL
jgi:hypothetical protein